MENEEALADFRKSFAWMELVMSMLASSVVVVDQNMCIVFANEAFTLLSGEKQIFLYGRSFLEVFAIYRNDHQMNVLDMNLPMSKKEALTLNGVYTMHTKNDSKYIEIEAAYIEKTSQAVLVIRDITEKRKADEEIYRINKELETFSYSVAHDLRAPLRAINGFSQALIEDCGEMLNETGKGHLRRIRSAAMHMGELIEGMINLSRVTRTTIDPQIVDLSALGAEIAATLQGTDPKRRVEFLIAKDLTAFADPTLMSVVMENLLDNAWKYTSRTPDARIEFGARVGDVKQTFFVQDNGVGFDMAYVGKLFTPFQRLHSSADFSGTGIGLATVARIIHRHGGEVAGVGEVGKGATFSFTIPSTV
jgi:light-regulated signal transduction histidine kinase (bacteriophytochrome)